MSRIVVLGGGESGVGSAVLAKVKGFDVFLSDMGNIADKYVQVLKDWDIAFESGGHSEELILNADEIVNGPGHLYDRSLYHAYFQLQAQITREFRYFSVYVGGENLTNYTISDPIRSAADPWSAMFDATQVWGPTEGAMFYIGMRFKLEKM